MAEPDPNLPAVPPWLLLDEYGDPAHTGSRAPRLREHSAPPALDPAHAGSKAPRLREHSAPPALDPVRAGSKAPGLREHSAPPALSYTQQVANVLSPQTKAAMAAEEAEEDDKSFLDKLDISGKDVGEFALRQGVRSAAKVAGVGPVADIGIGAWDIKEAMDKRTEAGLDAWGYKAHPDQEIPKEMRMFMDNFSPIDKSFDAVIPSGFLGSFLDGQTNLTAENYARHMYEGKGPLDFMGGAKAVLGGSTPYADRWMADALLGNAPTTYTGPPTAYTMRLADILAAEEAGLIAAPRSYGDRIAAGEDVAYEGGANNEGFFTDVFS